MGRKKTREEKKRFSNDALHAPVALLKRMYTDKYIQKCAVLFFKFFKNIECFFSIKVGHLITLLQILYKLMPGYITVGVSEGEKLATILLHPNDKYSIDYSPLTLCVCPQLVTLRKK